jgi:hypothetical protein
MALTLLQCDELSQEPEFRRRIKAALSRAAVAIHAETVTDAEDQQRASFASSVARDPGRFVDAAALAVAGQLADSTAASSDTTVYNTLSGVWSALAVSTKTVE